MEIQTTKVQSFIEKNFEVQAMQNELAKFKVPSKQKRSIGSTDLAVINANTKTLIQHNELDQALVLSTQALKIQSSHELTLKLLVEIFQLKKNVNDEVKILHALLSVSPKFEYYAQLGHAYYRQESFDFAENFYILSLTKNIHDEPHLFEVYKNLGNILVMKKDYEGAEENYHKAFTINSNSDQLFVNLGTLEIQKNQYDAAKEKFKRALTLNPKNTGAWTGLAMIYNEMSDFELAKANVLKVIDIDKGQRVAVHLAAQWFYRDGDLQKTEKILKDYLTTCDLDVEMSLVLIHVLTKVEKYQDALLEVERLLLWEPSRKEFYEIEQELRNKVRLWTL